MPTDSNSQNHCETDPDLELLSKEVGLFSSKWNDYFSRVDALASDVEIETALSEAKELRSRGLGDVYKRQLLGRETQEGRFQRIGNNF